MTDRESMAEALRLSRKGWPAPNPRVGCVIVRDGEIVGRGYHHRAGMPHAEVEALKDAGGKAKGADVFVTLEPCNHQGRTGPCSEALIEAGVVRVVYAVADPNPRAKGGSERLRESGVRVEHGLLEAEASAINERFLAAMKLRRPFVTVKAGISLDGRIALPSGESKWITGERARKEARLLRLEMGAVLVGPGTVLADDPALNSGMRSRQEWQPTRVVLDPRADLPSMAKVFDASAPTIHVLPSRSPAAPTRSEERVDLPLVAGRFPVADLLASLFELGHTGLLVEGGGATMGSFFQAGCVDAIELFLAPKVLGSGRNWVEGFELPNLSVAPEFEVAKVRKLGSDLRISLRPKG